LQDKRDEMIGPGHLNEKEMKRHEKRVHSNEKYHDPRGGTLYINVNQSGLYAGFSDDGLHPGGNIIEPVLGGSGYVYGLLHAYPELSPSFVLSSERKASESSPLV
jgi:hypothetical protein